MSPVMVKWSTVAVALGLVVVLAVVFRNQWPPRLNALFTTPGNRAEPVSDDGHGSQDDGRGHGHEGHVEGNSIELSPQARKNVRLETDVIELQTYVRTVSMPATVVGRTGRAEIEVTAPLGGRVTRVYPIQGEAVQPGQPLFDLRLTHEELVAAQSNLLRVAEELDVEAREIKRLQSAGAAIPGKSLRQREYEQQKLEASLNAQSQSLLLHGLTQEQINSILEERKLVQGVTVVTPEHPSDGHEIPEKHAFTVRSLHAKLGQYVDAGASLCLLMDYAELYIQGRAFEHDTDELLQAARKGWELTAIVEDHDANPQLIAGLKIVYVDNEVDPDSRALHFYVGLPNRIVHESKAEAGHRFLTWQYKPGQRMQLRVPVEQWRDRIVLPVDAVAQEGVEYYVFQQNGDHFDRVPVQVEYRDQLSTVIANDGSVFPGDVVATRGAHQLQMALKNQAGGGVDPHAGHNH
jgi:multidrug efflux pump subunit AcrA (membrane-fusion protein)